MQHLHPRAAGKVNWQRLPQIPRWFTVSNTTTRVANALGGLIVSGGAAVLIVGRAQGPPLPLPNPHCPGGAPLDCPAKARTFSAPTSGLQYITMDGGKNLGTISVQVKGGECGQLQLGGGMSTPLASTEEMSRLPELHVPGARVPSTEGAALLHMCFTSICSEPPLVCCSSALQDLSWLLSSLRARPPRRSGRCRGCTRRRGAKLAGAQACRCCVSVGTMRLSNFEKLEFLPASHLPQLACARPSLCCAVARM